MPLIGSPGVFTMKHQSQRNRQAKSDVHFTTIHTGKYMVTIAQLALITAQLNRSFAPLILIFGTIGNAINILVFSRRSLRKQPCSMYLLCASIVSLVALYSGLLSRLLSGYNLDISIFNNNVCKLRFFTAYWCLTVLGWFLVFASVDRYLSTSRHAHRRNFSHPRMAYRLIFTASLLGFLVYTSVFSCFGTSLLQSSRQCYSIGVICSFITDIQFLVLYSVLPTILMAVFGCLTVRNVQQLGRHVVPLHTRPTMTNHLPHHIRQKPKIQLLPMLLTQVALFVLFTVPVALSKLYTSLTNLLNYEKTNEQVAREAFSYSVTVLFTYANCAVSFYVYALTGRLFRKQLKETVYHLLDKN